MLHSILRRYSARAAPQSHLLARFDPLPHCERHLSALTLHCVVPAVSLARRASAAIRDSIPPPAIPLRPSALACVRVEIRTSALPASTLRQQDRETHNDPFRRWWSAFYVRLATRSPLPQGSAGRRTLRHRG